MGSFVVQTINTDPVKSHEKNNNKNRGYSGKVTAGHNGRVLN